MILPNPHLATQFKELNELQDGWLDGEGKALDKTGLAWLERQFTDGYARELPSPVFFPTSEANVVRIEWLIDRNDISLEVNLVIRRGYLHWMHLDSGTDLEADLNLQTKEGWTEVMNLIRKHTS